MQASSTNFVSQIEQVMQQNPIQRPKNDKLTNDQRVAKVILLATAIPTLVISLVGRTFRLGLAMTLFVMTTYGIMLFGIIQYRFELVKMAILKLETYGI